MTLTNQYAAHIIPVDSKVRAMWGENFWYNGITISKGEVGTIKKITMYIYIVEFPSYPKQEFYYEHCGGWNAGIEAVPVKKAKGVK